MESTLSAGAVGKIMSKEVTSEQQMMPVLQVTELKLVQEPMRERIFRMLLSDGTHLHQGMLVTAQNELVKEGILQVGSIVRLTRFICNEIQRRSIVIVLELEVLTTRSEIIGHPTMLDQR